MLCYSICHAFTTLSEMQKKNLNFVICLALQARQNKVQLIKNVIDTTHQNV